MGDFYSFLFWCYVAVIIVVIVVVIVLAVKKHKEVKKIQEIELKQKQYYNSVYENIVCNCKENGIEIPDSKILYSPRVRLRYGEESEYISGYYWNVSDKIVFNGTSNNIISSNKMIVIHYEDILFFAKDGDVMYTNRVYNTSESISISGAIIGGRFGRSTGAVIDAVAEPMKLKNETVSHDEVHTFVYCKTENGDVTVYDFTGKEFFSYIMRILPFKEYKYMSKNNNEIFDNTNSNDDMTSIRHKLEELKKLHEDGLIDESEYKAKKEQLLEKI